MCLGVETFYLILFPVLSWYIAQDVAVVVVVNWTVCMLLGQVLKDILKVCVWQ